MRMPTVKSVSSEAPATIFQPKYQLPTFDCVKVCLRFYFFAIATLFVQCDLSFVQYDLFFFAT